MAHSVPHKASNLLSGLRPALPGLDYATKQWLCGNYYIGYKHKGKPERMYKGFFQAASGMYTKASALPLDFNTVDTFEQAHWILLNVAEKGVNTKG